MEGTPVIRILDEADIPRVLAIAHLAGWTQTSADIERMLEYSPDGCFGLELPASNGRERCLASTAMAFPHGHELGWIAMVLTDPQQRGRGLATRLMRHCIDFLRDCGTEWIKLDASDFGRPLYERLGFATENLMERRLRPAMVLPQPIHPQIQTVVESGDLPLVLDQLGFGANRQRLLAMLSGMQGARTGVLPDRQGYAILRQGKNGMQLGPMVCADPAGAEALLRWGIARSGEAMVQWDLIRENKHAMDIAEHYSFEIHRVLHRMSLPGIESPAPFHGHNELVFSIAGFDFG